MSRELVLVPKRKYDDLVQRATAEKTVDDSNIPFVKRRRVEGNGDDTTSDDTSTIVNKTNKNTMNETIVGENQYGGAISNPFVKMTFKSFDKMHTKQGMKNNKKNKNLKWLSFQL